MTTPSYHNYLLKISTVANHVNDLIGPEKFEQLLEDNSHIQLLLLLRAEEIITHEQFMDFCGDLIKADEYFHEEMLYENNFYDEILGEPFDTEEYFSVHKRKNKARRHRKALKREKRGNCRSVPYSRMGWGLYNKLEKQSQMKKVQERDFKSQEREYNTIYPELEVISETDSTYCSDTQNFTPTESSVGPHTVHKKSNEELIGEAFKNGYHAGYDDGFENGKAAASHGSYIVGYEAGYAAAIKKVKEALAKFSSNL